MALRCSTHPEPWPTMNTKEIADMSKSTTPTINVNLIVETVSEGIQDELPTPQIRTDEEIKKEYDQCFYCDGLVRRSSKQSGDHFPLPKRHGGTMIVVCCQSCHDMKDRFDLRQWPAAWLPKIMEDLPKLNRETRIFLAKALSIVSDCLAKNKPKE